MTPRDSRLSAEAQRAEVGLSTEAQRAKVGLSTEAQRAKVDDHVRLAYFAWIAVCLLWGTTYLGIRVALETIPPATVGALRYLAAGGVLALVLRLRGESLPGPAHWRGLALLGFLMIGIGNGGVIWAEQWVPSGIAALLVATAPFWAALMERFRPSGEHIGVRRGLGMLIGFVGVALLVTPGATGAFDLHFVLGALAIQAGSMCWQYGTMRGKYNLADVPPLMSSAVQMIIGGAAVGIVGLSIGLSLIHI